MGYDCTILADSVNIDGHRLTSWQVTLPRIVLAELNTHRMLSKNSASSRAIPVEKQIARVLEDPFVPIYWGANQKGMQATEELSEAEQVAACSAWLDARDAAVHSARSLLATGLHKQITNRLLEPFMWHTVIVSATEVENFFNLRCHKDAQPELRKAVEMMRECQQGSTPKELRPGEWHLPMVEMGDLKVSGTMLGELLSAPATPQVQEELQAASAKVFARISAGRCARVSYLTHEGKRDPAADIALCERLVASGHMSPMEHPARAFTEAERTVSAHWGPGGWFCGNFKGFRQLRKMMPGEDVFHTKNGE